MSLPHLQTKGSWRFSLGYKKRVATTASQSVFISQTTASEGLSICRALPFQGIMRPFVLCAPSNQQAPTAPPRHHSAQTFQCGSCRPAAWPEPRPARRGWQGPRAGRRPARPARPGTVGATAAPAGPGPPAESRPPILIPMTPTLHLSAHRPVLAAYTVSVARKKTRFRFSK